MSDRLLPLARASRRLKSPLVRPIGSGNSDAAGVPASVIDEREGYGCKGQTRTGLPCRAPLTRSGWCLSHDPDRKAELRESRRRGGALANARRAVAKARRAAIEGFGVTAPLPTLDSVDSARSFLVGVAGKVLSRELSPAAANSLTAIVRASKELLSLETDIRLAERLDELEQGQPGVVRRR